MIVNKLPEISELGIEAAVFDLDGTLIDSMWIWERMMIDFVAKYKLELPEYVMNEFDHMSIVQSSEYICKEMALPMSPQEVLAEWKGYLYDSYAHQIKTKPGVKAYLKELKQNGITLGIATACDPLLCEACLKNNEIFDYFKSITYVDDVGKGKKHPDIYLECLRRLECKPEKAIVFDDIIEPLRTAKALRMITVAVEEPGNSDKEELIKEADYYIYSFM